MHCLSVRISSATNRKLRQLACEQKTSLSDAARSAIDRGLDNPPRQESQFSDLSRKIAQIAVTSHETRELLKSLIEGLASFAEEN